MRLIGTPNSQRIIGMISSGSFRRPVNAMLPNEFRVRLTPTFTEAHICAYGALVAFGSYGFRCAQPIRRSRTSLHPSWPGLSRPSRSGTHRARLSGVAGTSPAMTAECALSCDPNRGPGSAAHHVVRRCAQDTRPLLLEKRRVVTFEQIAQTRRNRKAITSTRGFQEQRAGFVIAARINLAADHLQRESKRLHRIGSASFHAVLTIRPAYFIAARP